MMLITSTYVVIYISLHDSHELNSKYCCCMDDVYHILINGIFWSFSL